MNAHIVPDTSVVIKWFRQGEVLADRALALRTAYVDGRLQVSVPSLLAYELTNVLRYKDDLTTAQVEEAVQSLFDMGLESVPPTAITMRRAAVIARCAISR
jgi:predicted nucleic acid-binding protein